MRTLAIAFLTLCAAAAGAATIRNADSCDIAEMPAATLLLPYFEVDFNASQSTARTTLFTVFNTTNKPQIARVTLWTDQAFPVLTFNIFLTGYDVQAINLYDVIGPRGTIAPSSGTSNNTAPGDRSRPNDANPNFLPSSARNCATLPGAIPSNLLADVRAALTTGLHSSCGTQRVGLTHANAIGYATIDVMATCGVNLPTNPAYYSELLYDNVLGGDWQVINPNPTTGNYAGGNPLVHIRAIPEGGPAGVVAHTNLPYTFYDRYTPRGDNEARAMDRRQPLPSTFVARYIQGGTGAFNTDLIAWREGVTGSDATCAEYLNNSRTKMSVADVVRFDEHENPTTLAGGIIIEIFFPTVVVLPAASSSPTSSGIFPVMPSVAGDVAGWMYMNLNNSGSDSYSSKVGATRPSQNWMVTSMSAEGRFQTAFDATALGNGCTPARPVTSLGPQPPAIGPGPNINP
jgi:hypothetical protein